MYPSGSTMFVTGSSPNKLGSIHLLTFLRCLAALGNGFAASGCARMLSNFVVRNLAALIFNDVIFF